MKQKADYTKLRGGYYTPKILTEFISKWAIRNDKDEILEPSCGDGGFIESIVDVFGERGLSKAEIDAQVLGIELDEKEAQKARQSGGNIVNSDFFTFYNQEINGKKRFDVVVGNPPFIRYQSFVEEYRKCAFKLMQQAGMHPNRLTNIWVPFLILACECLKENGRLGMVIPAELFQVDYAAETRVYLSQKFERLIIITFNKLLFDGAQQEVVLVLGERRSEKKGIEVIELDTAVDLLSFDIENSHTELKELDHSNEKWVKYYLTNEELTLLRRLQNDKRFIKTTELFEINVGVVSGQNDFFIINNEAVQKNSLQNAVQPIIGRAEQLKGIELKSNDLEKLKKENKKVFLFEPSDVEFEELSKEEQRYISRGEDQEYNKGYKCRIRKRWYIVPQSWNPDAFMLRQINKYPKMVMNRTNATNTDTLHKIRFKDGVKPEAVVTAFINSFTFAQCEITGRSYGGGVMTFEPGEVRRLQIPMEGADELDIKYIDTLIREGKLEEALDYNDVILLEKHLGLSHHEVVLLRGIWEKMSNRRIERKKKRKETD